MITAIKKQITEIKFQKINLCNLIKNICNQVLSNCCKLGKELILELRFGGKINCAPRHIRICCA